MPPCVSTSSWLPCDRTGTFCRMRMERRRGTTPTQTDMLKFRPRSRNRRHITDTVVVGFILDDVAQVWPQGWTIFATRLLFFSATWWECSTGQSACWNTASNLCTCLTASPHSSSRQRFVWVLIVWTSPVIVITLIIFCYDGRVSDSGTLTTHLPNSLYVLAIERDEFNSELCFGFFVT